MQIIKQRNQLTPLSTQLRAQGAKIGFVPTMGALHQGHISLVEASKKRANITIVSIFVNPTQFNDPKDLEKYPRPIEQDIAMLEAAGCDILYLPEASDIYGPVTQVTDKFDLAGLDLELEGASRPGHFAGVAQVVKILLEITRPDILFLGQKDFQQCLILTQLINSLKMPVELVMCPIYREPHGLAMSSRNVRLNPQIRQKAGAIYASLQYAAAMIRYTYPARNSASCNSRPQHPRRLQRRLFPIAQRRQPKTHNPRNPNKPNCHHNRRNSRRRATARQYGNFLNLEHEHHLRQ
ncbi:MAG: pantoate--beta-alanine ligase [Chitinophagaceae bacterium]